MDFSQHSCTNVFTAVAVGDLQVYIYIKATRKESSSGLLFFRLLVLSVLH